ncbi:MAG: hypothetical protein AAB539_00945 [Patescibacteria group bacterium]
MGWTKMDRMVAEARCQLGLMRQRPDGKLSGWRGRDVAVSDMLSGVLEKFCVSFEERPAQKKELGRRLQKYAPRRTRASRSLRPAPTDSAPNPRRAFLLSLAPGTQFVLDLRFFDEHYPCVS